MTLAVALDYRPALLGRSGIARATRELARALAADGACTLHLFGHSWARAAAAAAIPAGARLHRWPVPGRSLGLLARLGVDAARLAGGVQVFHWTDYVHPPVRSAAVVLTIHDLAFARDPSFHGADQAAELLARTRRAAAAAAAVIVPSAATADDVRRLLPEAPQPVVIPFGGDHVPPAADAAGPGSDTGHGPYALALGTVEPRKNHLGLLTAWRALRPPRPRLVVVGARGWQCDAAVAALQAAQHEGLIRWLEDADDATTFALLRGARLLVYPSRWEGFGFPVLEALQTGVPVVAGDCAALRELAQEAALFAPPDDPAALAAAIERLLHDAALRRQLTDAGRRRAGAFRWADCARAHVAVYRAAATGGHR